MRTPFTCVARVALGLGIAAVWDGCASVPRTRETSEVAAAHVTLVNLTGQPWRIGLRPAGGGGTRVERVDGGATTELTVRPGHYVVDQDLLAADGTVLATRAVPAEFAPAEYYQWALATFRSLAGGRGAARTTSP